MSIKGCYEELKNLKDVGIFSPARGYIYLVLRSILYAYYVPTMHDHNNSCT